jgi:hypothetical protein
MTLKKIKHYKNMHFFYVEPSLPAQRKNGSPAKVGGG